MDGYGSDTAKLRRWLDRRRASLEEARKPYESLWRDIRSYFEPAIGKALLDNENPNIRNASRDDEQILNSEPRTLLHRMAAGLQSGITNQSQEWFRFRALDDRITERQDCRKWLNELTHEVSAALERSNAYPALDRIYMQLVFGTAAAIIYPLDDSDIHIDVIDCGAYWIAENRRGRVDTLMRKLQMTLEQAASEFGESELPVRVREALDQGRGEEWIDVWNLVCPTDRVRARTGIDADRQFASIYWIAEKSAPNDGVVAIRSFGYNPIIAPRWMVNDSAYGIGCGQIGLGDAKEVRRIEEDTARMVELEAKPALLANASMKGETIRIGPGTITYGTMDGHGATPIQRLFQTNQNINAVVAFETSIIERLRRIFYSDLFSLMVNATFQSQQKTATEINELAAEKVALLGPVLTRLNNDLLHPLIEATYHILKEASDRRRDSDPYYSDPFCDVPRAADGQELRVEYVSNLHIERQSAMRINHILQLVQVTTGIAQLKPSVLAGFDEHAALRGIARSLDEEGIVKDRDVVERELAAQAAQAAQEQQVQLGQARAAGAKDEAMAMRALADTPMSDGRSALETASETGQGVVP